MRTVGYSLTASHNGQPPSWDSQASPSTQDYIYELSALSCLATGTAYTPHTIVGPPTGDVSSQLTFSDQPGFGDREALGHLATPTSALGFQDISQPYVHGIDHFWEVLGA